MTEYRELIAEEISITLFENFNRYQQVSKCWRNEGGVWVLKEIPFDENWSAEDYEHLVKCLKNTVITGGSVFGAFENGILVGFSSVENESFGRNKEYLQLSNLHVSSEHRGHGTGKKLFRISADKARELGAKKLYISAHSAEETQAFYKAMGCAGAFEYNKRLTREEPYDCQLEYLL